MPDTLKGNLIDRTLASSPLMPAGWGPYEAGDTFRTLDGNPGRAEVLSETVGKNGKRNLYEICFALSPATANLSERLRVLDCGCIAFCGGGCRHAVKMFDILNLPPVLAAMQEPGAYVLWASRSHDCSYCRMRRGDTKQPVYRVRYFAGRGGFQITIQCPACLLTGVSTR